MDLEELILENKRLKEENIKLKLLLKKNNICFNDLPLINFSTKDKIKIYMDYFKGRTDVYAEKYVQKDGKKGYAKVCKNRFSILCDFKKYKQCKECPNETYIPLDENTYFKHLQGKTSLGIYPIVECKYTFFLAIDFDGEKFKEANRPDGSIIPTRYSRHYYDLYRIVQKNLHITAISNMKLLYKVAEFKERFYPRRWAKYDLAKEGKIKLFPAEHNINELKRDYEKMRAMIYGNYPRFEEILDCIKSLEDIISAILEE